MQLRISFVLAVGLSLMGCVSPCDTLATTYDKVLKDDATCFMSTDPARTVTKAQIDTCKKSCKSNGDQIRLKKVNTCLQSLPACDPNSNSRGFSEFGCLNGLEGASQACGSAVGAAL
jgi:hypothetical protein